MKKIKFTKRQLDTLYRRYCNLELSLTDLGRFYDVSYPTLQKLLIENGYDLEKAGRTKNRARGGSYAQKTRIWRGETIGNVRIRKIHKATENSVTVSCVCSCGNECSFSLKAVLEAKKRKQGLCCPECMVSGNDAHHSDTARSSEKFDMSELVRKNILIRNIGFEDARKHINNEDRYMKLAQAFRVQKRIDNLDRTKVTLFKTGLWDDVKQLNNDINYYLSAIVNTQSKAYDSSVV